MCALYEISISMFIDRGEGVTGRLIHLYYLPVYVWLLSQENCCIFVTVLYGSETQSVYLSPK